MTDWDAALYLRFERERTRAAIDLLAAVPLTNPGTIADLGCGPGNSTALLQGRYPSASIVGVDTSPDMLAKARVVVPGATFEQTDVAAWLPARPPDLIFANAVLQWLPDHATLLPRLLGVVAPGGVLAIQMPDNLDEPSHAFMRETARNVPFSAKIAGAAAARTTLPSFAQFYAWLQPHAADVDLWRTTYVHRLDGPPAIVKWLEATGLRPFLEPLTAGERTEFLARYEERLSSAYPRQVDGRVLLSFPRVFIVATKR